MGWKTLKINPNLTLSRFNQIKKKKIEEEEGITIGGKASAEKCADADCGPIRAGGR